MDRLGVRFRRADSQTHAESPEDPAEVGPQIWTVQGETVSLL